MGKKDSVTKEYMRDSVVFADAFNWLLYDGEQKIDQEQLKELDVTEITTPYGADRAVLPEQKYRDVLKVLMAKTDGNAAYCIMGIENQSDIHYAMPVRNGVYDFLQLSRQVSEAAKSHKMADSKRIGEKPRREEYLSGFWKTDKLIPVITLVVYFGSEKWDAPLSLKEMYVHEDEEILKCAADYRVNLLAPGLLEDEEIDKFHTSLREVMLYIKYSKDKKKLREIVTNDENFREMERQAVEVINTVTSSKLEYSEGEERVDMCLAIDEMRKESEEIGEMKGAVMTYKELGLSTEDAVGRIARRFHLSETESNETVTLYWNESVSY